MVAIKSSINAGAWVLVQREAKLVIGEVRYLQLRGEKVIAVVTDVVGTPRTSDIIESRAKRLWHRAESRTRPMMRLDQWLSFVRKDQLLYGRVYELTMVGPVTELGIVLYGDIIELR